MVLRVRVAIRGRVRRDDFVIGFREARKLVEQARRVDPKARISVALFDLVGVVPVRELFRVRSRGRVPIPRLVVAENDRKLPDHYKQMVNERLVKGRKTA